MGLAIVLLLCKLAEAVYVGDYMSMLLSGGLICLFARGIYELPSGTVTQEGVAVRHFFIRRFYRWEDLRQAGVLRCYGRSNDYDIVLVKSKGDFQDPESFFCWLKNQFHLIYIPYDESLMQQISGFYGTPDFDQRKREQA